MTPTQRTLAELRERGYLAAVVEKWIPAAAGGFRLDLFGIIDVLGIIANGTLGVQACGEAWSTHVQKLMQEKEAVCLKWLECPARRLEIWGWSRRKPRGQRAYVQLRRGIIYIKNNALAFWEVPQ